MSALDLTLHIGYHKTGTTFLQRAIFPHHSEVLYLGKPWRNKKLEELFSQFNFEHPLRFDPRAFKNSFNAALEAIPKTDDMTAALLSQEDLHSGPEWFGLRAEGMAHRIATVFPEAKIIIGLRNQIDFVESFYKNYVFHGGKYSFKGFIERSFYYHFALSPKLEYDRVVELYARLFGSDRLLVYFHCEMKQDLPGVLNQMQAFLGLGTPFHLRRSAMNVGVNPAVIEPMRLINVLLADDFVDQYGQASGALPSTRKDYLRRQLVRLIRRLGQAPFLHERACRPISTVVQRRKIREYYANSNSRLSAVLGRELPGSWHTAG